MILMLLLNILFIRNQFFFVFNGAIAMQREVSNCGGWMFGGFDEQEKK